MMDAISDRRYEEITVMKSVRTGGTQAIIDNAIGYFMHQDPGPMLMVHPGKTEARDWSKDHFDTMVRDTPCLHGRVFSDKIKDRKNEILHKQFPGGMLYIIGSNSAAGFRQKTIQRVFLDDIDGYDVSAGNEGDQIQLARNRTISYLHHHRKIIKVSNPTTRGISKIEREFLKSDQRHYFVPCPECAHFQTLIFSPESQFKDLATSYLRFDKHNLSYVFYECENCKAKLDERHKLAMIAGGKWRALKPEVTDHAGFHLSELISPFSSWPEIVKSFLDAKRMTEELRVFINQRLGESFEEDRASELSEDYLLNRCEEYVTQDHPYVPEGVLVMTAAVDVQPDRLEATIEGWGKGFENWFVDKRVIIGSPERESTWRELDEYLALEWKHESGLLLRPWISNGLNCVCVDSGYSATSVYSYIKKRQGRRFFALKGDTVKGPKGKEMILSVHYRNRLRARLALINVDALTSRVFDRLEMKDPGPGFMHFPKVKCNKEFFEQLTSEKRIPMKNKFGYREMRWILPSGKRNEMLDCKKYNLAAVMLLSPDFEKLKMKLDERIASKQENEETPAKGEEELPREKEKKMSVLPRRRRTNWTIKV